MNRKTKRLAAGLAGTGIVTGVLVGAGVAYASSGPSPAATLTAATTATTQYGPGWCADGLGLGRTAGQQPVLSSAATYLGLTQAQLHDQLQAGKSLADVAGAQGKSVDGLKNAILAAVTEQINASTRLTAEQKAERTAEVKSHLNEIVNETHPLGDGPHRADMPAGMGLGYRGGR